jgi:hypothetical protein
MVPVALVVHEAVHATEIRSGAKVDDAWSDFS